MLLPSFFKGEELAARQNFNQEREAIARCYASHEEATPVYLKLGEYNNSALNQMTDKDDPEYTDIPKVTDLLNDVEVNTFGFNHGDRNKPLLSIVGDIFQMSLR